MDDGLGDVCDDDDDNGGDDGADRGCYERAEGARAALRAPPQARRAQISLTSCFPKLRPLSKPMNASGADSMPWAIVSRYLILPAATRPVSMRALLRMAARHGPARRRTSAYCLA